MKLGNGKTDQGFVAAKNAPWNEILTSLLCEGNNYKKVLEKQPRVRISEEDCHHSARKQI